MSKGFRKDAEPVYESSTDFIKGAASHTVIPETMPASPAASGEPKPWEAANPRVKVVFSVRMDEPLHKKLAYVAEHVPGTSMHSIMLEAAREKIDALLKELEK
jgi:hypothetical protein